MYFSGRYYCFTHNQVLVEAKRSSGKQPRENVGVLLVADCAKTQVDGD